jgi:PadR family transcriptional regulator, regulatory protein PadR
MWYQVLHRPERLHQADSGLDIRSARAYLLSSSDRSTTLPDRKDIPQGTLDLLILRILTREPMHGWGIMQRLRDLTGDVFQVAPGSLFPALQRIEEAGWASGDWGVSENNRRAKYYAITPAGRRQLTAEQARWNTITLAVARVLESA